MEQFTDDQLAEVAHAIVRSLKRENGEADPGPLSECPEWMREDTLLKVQTIRDGASLDPRIEHERWVASKVAKGYSYGSVRNDDPAKGPLRHPLIVPYEDLSLLDQLKDLLPSEVIADLI